MVDLAAHRPAAVDLEVSAAAADLAAAVLVEGGDFVKRQNTLPPIYSINYFFLK